jgi:uncharacterized protein DUF4399
MFKFRYGILTVATIAAAVGPTLAQQRPTPPATVDQQSTSTPLAADQKLPTTSAAAEQQPTTAPAAAGQKSPPPQAAADQQPTTSPAADVKQPPPTPAAEAKQPTTPPAAEAKQPTTTPAAEAKQPTASPATAAKPASTPAATAQSDSGQSNAPSGAYSYIVNLKNGATVTSPFKVVFGLSPNMGVAPSGVEKPNVGHHHLLVDKTLTPEEMTQPVMVDEQHVHFGKGQTETTVTLPPGKHTLQLILGDWTHIPFKPPVQSEIITVTVKAAIAAAPATAATAKNTTVTRHHRMHHHHHRKHHRRKHHHHHKHHHHG